MFIGVSSRYHGCGFFSYMIFYFSGTGNSRWVATQMAAALGEELFEICEARRKSLVSFNLCGGETVGLVFPVHAWSPPKVVLDFISEMRFSIYPSYMYFVCTCGDDTGKTAEVLCRTARRRGWICDAGYSVTMPNTYVCLPGFDVDAGELERKKLSAAVGRVSEIIAELRERRTGFHLCEGSMPWAKTYILGPLFRHFLMRDKKFHTTEACTGCRICERVCPMHNISMQDGRPRWRGQCTMCLACYHHCPGHAVHFGKETLDKGQYTNTSKL